MPALSGRKVGIERQGVGESECDVNTVLPI